MSNYEGFHAFQNGLSTATALSGLRPPTAIEDSKKNKHWRKATMDFFERYGVRQLQKNLRFREYRKMVDGQFTYIGTGMGEFQEMPWFDNEIRKLREDKGIPTYVKHFDFIGIVCNALLGVYDEFLDMFEIDSTDEYATNEFIRMKTEMMHQSASQVFQEELQRMLMMRGVDVNKKDFQSEEEAQQYQQYVAEQSKALTPEEIEVSLSKNFKVLAVEWAQNTITTDRTEFRIDELDRENFLDYLLTGRYFKHFRVGYDSYSVERWSPEETFFSQDVEAKYPQEGEFIGRIRNLSPDSILNIYGHLLTAKEQEQISNYWNQSLYYRSSSSMNAGALTNTLFPEARTVPFQNYYTHDLMTQYEDALGEPMAMRTLRNKEGDEYTIEDWMPRYYANTNPLNTNVFAKYLRNDIEVRQDTIQVTEVYFRNYKRMGLLTYENEIGAIAQVLVTDDLLSGFLTENEIEKIKDVSLEEVKIATDQNRLSEYVNTIVYTYHPEVWKGVKIRGNKAVLKNDLYLDIRPLDFQIKGSRSKTYDFQLPVAGIITTSPVAQRLEPYQILHNISMNQITELLEKELGVFFTFDILYLPSEYKDMDTEQAILEMRDMIRDIGLMPIDMSKQNTAGNQPLVNSFQRQDVTFASQVQYRQALAQYYKMEGLSQIGITPQLLGQANTYVTSEGVKQGAQASYALLAPIFEKFNTAKAKEMEVHIAVAQYCQSSGKDQTVLYRKGDGELSFLNIMVEDGELFPLRHLGVAPKTNAKDRKILETVRNLMLNDNTMQRDLKDVIDVLTNPNLLEVKDAAQRNRIRHQKETEAQRQHESEMADKQIQANQASIQEQRQFDLLKQKNQLDSNEKIAYMSGMAKAVDTNATIDELNLYKTEMSGFLSKTKMDADIEHKQNVLEQKTQNDIEKNKATIQQLGLKAREISVREREAENKRFGDIINKN